MIAVALLLAAGQHAGDGAAAGCTPEHAALGHCRMPEAPVAAPVPVPPPAPTPAPVPPPVPSGADGMAADRIWGAEAMAASRRQLRRDHGGGTFSQVMLNLAEARLGKGHDGYHWDGEAWFGGDRDRLVVKSEGAGGFGGALDDLEVQALYSRAIGPYFNLQAGVRHDVRPRPQRTYLAAGVEGLAPYWFELEATAFLSDRGRLSGRVEGYYDQRITQRLILQPRAEVNLALQGDRERGVGSGISDLELGLRLRYEIVREFAPYVGVAWERRLGTTARIARAAGDGASDLNVVAGVRIWF